MAEQMDHEFPDHVVSDTNEFNGPEAEGLLDFEPDVATDVPHEPVNDVPLSGTVDHTETVPIAPPRRVNLGFGGRENWFELVEPHEALHSQRHIRLLYVERFNEYDGCFETALIQGSLEAATNDGARYCALSYCWGDEPANRSIRINGRRHPIQPNLFDAIRAVFDLRARGNVMSATEVLMLWIDAICINQSNAREKSAQIRLMNNIYRSATRVLIWLGRDTDDSHMVMSTLQWMEAISVQEKLRVVQNLEDEKSAKPNTDTRAELLRRAADSERELSGRLQWHYNITGDTLFAFYQLFHRLDQQHNLPSTIEERRNFLSSSCDSSKMFSRNNEFWPAFFSLMARPWFSRVWTLEECLLAQTATVLCGGSAVDWLLVRATRRYLFTTLWAGVLFTSESWQKSPARDSMTRASISQDYLYRPSETEFVEYLRHTGGRRTKNPRDYVYGVLGVVNQKYAQSFEVDYTLPVQDVFVSATQSVLEHDEGVRFWARLIESYKYAPVQVTALPSWCPDFTSRNQESAELLLDGWWEKVTPGVGDMAGNSRGLVDKSQRWVEIPALILDEIHCAVDTTPPSMSDIFVELHPEAVKNGLVGWRQTLVGDESQLWLSQVADLFSAQSIEGEAVLQSWLRRHFFTVPRADLTDEVLIPRFRALKTEDILSRTIKCRADLDALVQIVVDGCRGLGVNHGKYWFVTKSGRAGFSAKPAHENDQVCYVPGGEYLQVLSPDRSRYVTTACVDGLMGDEMGKGNWSTVRLY